MSTQDAIIDEMMHHGIKPTANRILIAAAMRDALRPLSMTEIEQLLESVDKSVISRTMALFRECRFVHVLPDGGDGFRYELCHAGGHGEGHRDDDTHVHFYCTRCRRTLCLEHIPIPSVPLPEGYAEESSYYMVTGICPDCR